MAKYCQITGKMTMSGNNVSHSNRKTRRVFQANLFRKKFFLEEEDRWIELMVSPAGMRTISKLGVYNALKKADEKGIICLM